MDRRAAVADAFKFGLLTAVCRLRQNVTSTIYRGRQHNWPAKYSRRVNQLPSMRQRPSEI